MSYRTMRRRGVRVRVLEYLADQVFVYLSTGVSLFDILAS